MDATAAPLRNTPDLISKIVSSTMARKVADRRNRTYRGFPKPHYQTLREPDRSRLSKPATTNNRVQQSRVVPDLRNLLQVENNDRNMTANLQFQMQVETSQLVGSIFRSVFDHKLTPKCRSKPPKTCKPLSATCRKCGFSDPSTPWE